MAVKFSCKCPQKNDEDFRLKNWKILQYKQHRSAFAGYKKTESVYSTVKCEDCGAVGRTKANYVDEIYYKGLQLLLLLTLYCPTLELTDLLNII